MIRSNQHLLNQFTSQIKLSTTTSLSSGALLCGAIFLSGKSYLRSVIEGRSWVWLEWTWWWCVGQWRGFDPFAWINFPAPSIIISSITQPIRWRPLFSFMSTSQTFRRAHFSKFVSNLENSCKTIEKTLKHTVMLQSTHSKSRWKNNRPSRTSWEESNLLWRRDTVPTPLILFLVKTFLWKLEQWLRVLFKKNSNLVPSINL